MPDDLAYEEGIPIGSIPDGSHESVVRLVAQELTDQGARLLLLESRQTMAVAVVEARKHGERVGEWMGIVHPGVPIGADHEERDEWVRSGDVLEQTERDAVGPVQVVEEQHPGRSCAGACEEAGDGVEELESGAAGTGPERPREFREPVGEIGKELGENESVGSELGSQRRIVLVGEERPESLHPSPVGRRILALRIPAFEHLEAVRTSDLGGLTGRARLPDPRLSREQHHATVTRARGFKRVFELQQKAGAPDKWPAQSAVIAERGVRRRAHLDHGSREAEAPLAQGLHEPRLGTGVAQRPAQVSHGAAQGGVAHRHAWPERVEELVARHDATPVADEMEQELQGERLERDGDTAPPQVAGLLVELDVVEGKNHRALFYPEGW